MTAQLETSVDQGHLLRIIENELEDLPTLPSVVVRVMETVNDPSKSAADIKELISADQALTAKILRLVNSSFYGFPGRITTITHAVVILGFSTVRNLAISLGVSSGLGPGKGPAALNREDFWAHSVAVAYASSLIAKRKNATNRVLEEVFIGGLLHDIGKLFLDKYFSELYATAISHAFEEKVTILEAERAVLGVNHSVIGAKVGEKWNLPAATRSMVSLHHETTDLETHAENVYIVHAADYLVKKSKLGNAGDHVDPLLDANVEEWLSFSDQTWAALEMDTLKKFDSASEFLQAMLGK